MVMVMGVDDTRALCCRAKSIKKGREQGLDFKDFKAALEVWHWARHNITCHGIH